MKPHDARTLSPDALFDLRTRVVAAVRAGMSQSQAARVFGVHRSAVNRWCQGDRARRCARAGGAASRPADRSTRARTAELLDAIRTRHPDDLGLCRTRCGPATRSPSTPPRRFGVRRSRWVWGRWLRRHNFTPQRPARKAYQQDPADLARWRAEAYPAIAAEAKRCGAEVHWLDEAGVRTDHNPGTGYSPAGPAAGGAGERAAGTG